MSRCIQRATAIVTIAMANLIVEQDSFKQLLDSLPRYSSLRSEARTSETIEKPEPYMAYMTAQGIRRTSLQLVSVWHQGKAEKIRIATTVYFDTYDGPHGQIQPEKMGSPDLIEEAAVGLARNATLVHGVDHPVIANPEDKQVCTFVELFDTTWFPGKARPWFACGEFGRSPLSDAAAMADARQVQTLLEHRKFSQNDLDDALFHAVKNLYDNSDVIEALVQAGADINGRDARYNLTPLMWALDRPIQVPTLIKLGASLRARDRNGNTALTIARNDGLTLTAEILQNAGTQN